MENKQMKLYNFQKDLEHLINKHSIENFVNMPDYMLADLMCRNLQSMGEIVLKRDRWMGYKDGNVKQLPQDRD